MEKLTSVIPKEDIRALVQRLRMMYRSDPDEIAYRLGDLLNIPKQEAYRLAIESAPSLRHTVDDLFSASHAEDCQWVTIRGNPVCIKDKGDNEDIGEKLTHCSRAGACIPSAYEDLTKRFRKEAEARQAFLIHGWVFSPALDRDIKHAWLEVKGRTWEPVTEQFLDEKWTKLLNPREVKRYDLWQAMTMSIRTKSKGGEFDFNSIVMDIFNEAHADDGDCKWVTINGSAVCIKDRNGDGKGDLPERFGGPKETGKSADFTTASSNHAKFAEAHKDLIGYSFNPTSNKGFSAYKEDGSENTEVNKGIHKDYSDGENPVYFIGITNHQGGLSRESESAYNQASGEGHTPLIGYFKGDIEYTDISYPVNAGISEAEVKKLLDNHAQESALVIDKAGKVTFLPGANIKPPKGGKAPLP